MIVPCLSQFQRFSASLHSKNFTIAPTCDSCEVEGRPEGETMLGTMFCGEDVEEKTQWEILTKTYKIQKLVWSSHCAPVAK